MAQVETYRLSSGTVVSAILTLSRDVTLEYDNAAEEFVHARRKRAWPSW